MDSHYEADETLSQYLLFHYGEIEDFRLPDICSEGVLNFPVRCVSECVKISGARALDLGCAVGRSSFELTKNFKKVIGVDFSEKFIRSANLIKEERQFEFSVKEEGSIYRNVRIDLSSDIKTERVSFLRADVQTLDVGFYDNDLVLAANLLCRLKDPAIFLQLVKNLVKVGGQFVLISPYSWLCEYTEPKSWLSRDASLNSEKSIIGMLEPNFTLINKLDLPFLIREHARKFQLGISQALIFNKDK